MNNDFISGMQILIDCKKLVEDLIKENEYTLEQMDRMGVNSNTMKTVQNRIDKYRRVLNGGGYYGLYDEKLNND